MAINLSNQKGREAIYGSSTTTDEKKRMRQMLFEIKETQRRGSFGIKSGTSYANLPATAIMVKNSNNISTDPEILQWKKNITTPRWTAIYFNREGDAILYSIDLVKKQIHETYIIKQSSPGINCIQITMNDESTKNIQVLGWIDDGTLAKMTPEMLRSALNDNNLQALPKLIGISNYKEETTTGIWVERSDAPIMLIDIKSVEPIECPPPSVKGGSCRRSKRRGTKRRGTNRTRRHK